MGHTRTVTLELLRHGPPHNQLLSPLTQYLALCGNHPATTLSIPFEHNQFLLRLNAFDYQDSRETRQLQLKDTAAIMADVLGKVPGLIAELAESPGENEVSLTHLRLILSASELALLPFELANAPNGFPGAGQPLTLQAQAPLCITREVRRVSNTRYHWPTQPRVLFLAASPGGTRIPLEAHLLALRKVVDPWVEPSDDLTQLKDRLGKNLVVQTQASVASIQQACAEGEFTHVHVLAHGVPVPGEQDKRYGLALHTDHDPSVTDVVDGSRLATLLRTYSKRGNSALSGPAVVTLASCEGGNGGSVVGAGASIAHALHEGGIPLVVAAQFPLSFPASVLMAEVLYDGLLWGTDPRILLNDLRWRLKSIVRETHDWASLVAYASLPADLESQLSQVRFQQSRRCINTALKSMDRVTDKMKTENTRPSEPSPPQTPEVARTKAKKTRPNKPSPPQTAEAKTDQEAAKERARRKITDAEKRLLDLLRDPSHIVPYERAQIYGLLASTAKRNAELLYRASLDEDESSPSTETGTATGTVAQKVDDRRPPRIRPTKTGTGYGFTGTGTGTGTGYGFTGTGTGTGTGYGFTGTGTGTGTGYGFTGTGTGTGTGYGFTGIGSMGIPRGGKAREGMKQALQQARDYYDDAFRVDRGSNWALTQELCLAAVLGSMPDLEPSQSPLIPRDRWTVARKLAEYDLTLPDSTRVGWSHGSLIELYMLRLLMPPEPGLPDQEKATHLALEHAERLVEVGGRDSIEVYSTRRQIERYTNWFNEISPRFVLLENTARDVLGVIPFNPRFA